MPPQLEPVSSQVSVADIDSEEVTVVNVQMPSSDVVTLSPPDSDADSSMFSPQSSRLLLNSNSNAQQQTSSRTMHSSGDQPDDDNDRSTTSKRFSNHDEHGMHARTSSRCCTSGCRRTFCEICPDVLKYLVHVMLFFSLLVAMQMGVIWARQRLSVNETDPVQQYGLIPTIILFVLRSLGILAIPQVVFSALGHLCFNPFRERIKLRVNLADTPRLIFRVVTRGNYPELVRHNVERNLRTIYAAGLENFFIEVVTDKPLNLPLQRRVKETVVPADYRPASGALFKARALQYCLEPATCWADDADWLVHLDEETLLTQHSTNGIINFTTENAHDFGQGVITYAQEHVVNWIFTLADSFRVADDLGKLQFQLRVLKRPVFGWKGSFVLSRAGAERLVTFDHGPDGSIAEDTYFAFIAFQKHYRFGFVEGHMLEKSPFTMKDFVQQRKRWIQGLLLVAHSRKIAFHLKLLFLCSLYAWLLLPVSTVNLIVSTIWPIPSPWWLDSLNTFLLSQSLYMYIIGAFKTCSLKRASLLQTVAIVLGALLTLPINIAVENVAAVWGVIGHKHRFYIVDKNFLSRTNGAAGFSTEPTTPTSNGNVNYSDNDSNNNRNHHHDAVADVITRLGAS